MAKKQGLGRGLKSLINEDLMMRTETAEHTDKQPDIVFELELSKIRPNAEQPRKTFDEESLTELASSIKEYGILQPLVIKPENGGYTIIAGERRFRAAGIAGIKTVPVIIKDLPQREVLEIALIENVQRENLNPIEEALAYKKLIEEFGLTQSEMADRIGKNRVTITNKMRLLNLPEKIREMLLKEAITAGHAKTLLSLEDEKIMIDLAQEIAEKNLSVRDAEKRVRKLQQKDEKPKINSEKQLFFRACEERLKIFFSTSVKIKTRGTKGSIEITYHSEEELNQLLAMMTEGGKNETGEL